MKFVTTIYDYSKTGTSSREKFAFAALAVSCIIMFGINREFLPNHKALNYITYAGFIIFLGLEVPFYFAKVNHTKKQEGYIDINVKYIKWNQEEIAWESIAQIEMTYSDHQGEFADPYGDNFGSKRSTGLNNKIKIILNDSREYNSNLLIKSRESGKQLNRVLWEVVKHNSISLDNAERMVHPKNYKEHEELREYCA